MEKFTTVERVGGIAERLKSNEELGKFTMKQIKAVLDADADVIADALLRGESVILNKVGVLKLRTVKEREERTNSLPIGGIIEAKPSHSKIKFKVNKALADAVAEKTMGHPFQ